MLHGTHELISSTSKAAYLYAHTIELACNIYVCTPVTANPTLASLAKMKGTSDVLAEVTSVYEAAANI